MARSWSCACATSTSASTRPRQTSRCRSRSIDAFAACAAYQSMHVNSDACLDHRHSIIPPPCITTAWWAIASWSLWQTGSITIAACFDAAALAIRVGPPVGGAMRRWGSKNPTRGGARGGGWGAASFRRKQRRPPARLEPAASRRPRSPQRRHLRGVLSRTENGADNGFVGGGR